MSAGSSRTSDDAAEAVASSLAGPNTEIVYLRRAESAHDIATVVAAHRADAVELCLAGSGGILLLRELLRELIRIGRRDVSIVVHRLK